MNIDFYLSLPWTVERSERNDDGRYFVLRIAELPGFVVAARTEDELKDAFWDALEVFIESYLKGGETPPVPASVRGVVETLREQQANVRAMRRVHTGRPVCMAEPALSAGFDETSAYRGLEGAAV